MKLSNGLDTYVDGRGHDMVIDCNHRKPTKAERAEIERMRAEIRNASAPKIGGPIVRRLTATEQAEADRLRIERLADEDPECWPDGALGQTNQIIDMMARDDSG